MGQKPGTCNRVGRQTGCSQIDIQEGREADMRTQGETGGQADRQEGRETDNKEVRQGGLETED